MAAGATAAAAAGGLPEGEADGMACIGQKGREGRGREVGGGSAAGYVCSLLGCFWLS